MKIEIEITGTTPLICNRFTDAAAEAATNSTRGASSAADRGTPLEQAGLKLYRGGDGKTLIIPQPNLLRCLVEGGGFHKAGKSKITTQRSSLLYSCLDIEGAEIPILHKEPWRVDTRAVRIPSTGGRILTHRPMFDDWMLRFIAVLDTEVIGVKLLRNIVDFRIMSKAWAEKNKTQNVQDYAKKEEIYASRNTNGTGPYLIKGWEPDKRIVFAANKDWWGKLDGNVTDVIYTPIKADATRVAALISGDVDLVTDLPVQDVERLRKEPKLKVLDGHEVRTIFIGMDQYSNELKYSNVKGKNPFKDVRVRKALNMAVDRETIKKVTMRGLSIPGGLMIAPGVHGYSKEIDIIPRYDVAGAKKLLAEAGYPNGFEAVLRVAPQYYYTVRTGEVLAAQLQKIGVRIKIEQVEWGQWLSRVWKDAEYDLTIIGHAEAWDIANYANPKYYFRYDNADFQKLFTESEITVDDKARRELYVRMQKKLVEDAPVVWLYIHPRLAVTKKGLQGIWQDLPLPAFDLSEVAWAK